MVENDTPIVIILSQEELDGLIILAKNKRRDIQNEAAMLIRRCLEEYGLIPWRPNSHMPVDEMPVKPNEA